MAATIQNEGFLGLYKGLSGPLITVPLINAIIFSTFEQAKRFLAQGNSPEELNLAEIALAGGYAGFCNSFIISPIELVKSRLQVQYEAQRVRSFYHGSLHCAKVIAKQEGLRKLMTTGLAATILREVPAYSAQFFTYEVCKGLALRYYTNNNNNTNSDDSSAGSVLPASVQLLCGGVAGIGCWLASYPQDLIKSRLQVQSAANSPYLGFIDCAAKTLRTEGFRGLWVGFGTCAARAFIANAVGFFAYEFSLDLLKKWRRSN
jgi:solute carrier family 25 carnitine/acylcarnitine transporter 20/29